MVYHFIIPIFSDFAYGKAPPTGQAGVPIREIEVEHAPKRRSSICPLILCGRSDLTGEVDEKHDGQEAVVDGAVVHPPRRWRAAEPGRPFDAGVTEWGREEEDPPQGLHRRYHHVRVPQGDQPNDRLDDEGNNEDVPPQGVVHDPADQPAAHVANDQEHDSNPAHDYCLPAELVGEWSHEFPQPHGHEKEEQGSGELPLGSGVATEEIPKPRGDRCVEVGAPRPYLHLFSSCAGIGEEGCVATRLLLGVRDGIPNKNQVKGHKRDAQQVLHGAPPLRFGDNRPQKNGFVPEPFLLLQPHSFIIAGGKG